MVHHGPSAFEIASLEAIYVKCSDQTKLWTKPNFGVPQKGFDLFFGTKLNTNWKSKLAKYMRLFVGLCSGWLFSSSQSTKLQHNNIWIVELLNPLQNGDIFPAWIFDQGCVLELIYQQGHTTEPLGLENTNQALGMLDLKHDWTCLKSWASQTLMINHDFCQPVSLLTWPWLRCPLHFPQHCPRLMKGRLQSIGDDDRHTAMHDHLSNNEVQRAWKHQDPSRINSG